MKITVTQTPDSDETTRLVAAVAYATRRAALERKARAAVRRRDWAAAGRLAAEARALDSAALAGKE